MPVVVNTELGVGPGRGARLQARSSPRTSPTRSSRRSRRGRVRRVRAASSMAGASTALGGAAAARAGRGDRPRAMKADQVLADADHMAARRTRRGWPSESPSGQPGSRRPRRTSRPPSDAAEPRSSVSRLSRRRQPVGDQLADQRRRRPPGGNGRRPRSRRGAPPPDRGGEALAGGERQHRVRVGPQHQLRPLVVPQRLEHALPRRGARHVGRGRAASAGTRARRPWRRRRERRVVGGDHLVAGVASGRRRGRAGRPAGPRCARRSRGTPSTRRSSAGGR